MRIVEDVDNFVDVAVEELAAADGMQKTMYNSCRRDCRGGQAGTAEEVMALGLRDQLLERQGIELQGQILENNALLKGTSATRR